MNLITTHGPITRCIVTSIGASTSRIIFVEWDRLKELNCSVPLLYGVLRATHVPGLAG